MHSIATRVSNWLAGIACTTLVVLMVITFVDVIGRYFFSAPLTFGVELIQLGMGLIILLGMPLTTMKRGHIAVDLVSGALPKPFQLLLSILASLCGAIFISLMAWRLMDRALNFMSDGLVTDILGMPVYPVAIIMSLAAGIAAAISFYLVLRPSAEAPSILPQIDGEA